MPQWMGAQSMYGGRNGWEGNKGRNGKGAGLVGVAKDAKGAQTAMEGRTKLVEAQGMGGGARAPQWREAQGLYGLAIGEPEG